MKLPKEKNDKKSIRISHIDFEEILKDFQRLSSDYDNFLGLTSNNQSIASFKSITKKLYDYGQVISKQSNIQIVNDERSNQQLKPLHNLLIDKFDIEQIWQQLELYNETLLRYACGTFEKTRQMDQLSLNIDIDSSNDENKAENNHITAPKDDKITEETKSEKKRVKFQLENDDIRPEETNHDNQIDFFDLNEMEKYLDEQDEKEMNPNNSNADEDMETIDHLYEFPSDDDDEDMDSNENMMYSDFFDPPPAVKQNKQVEMPVEGDEQGESEDGEDDDDQSDLDMRDYDFDEQSADDQDDELNRKLKALAQNDDQSDSENEDDGLKSEYEKSQARLKRRIAKAEQELLQPSNVRWQLSGETNAIARPTNSLLEEHLQFDHLARPPPLITDETTNKLETLIKQRIKDRIFDDVERKHKPVEQPFEYRRRILLESEKSKIGLAEVYEQEYLKQQQRKNEQENSLRNFDAFISAGEQEENETRKEIRRQIRVLFRKLDSLSAFHFTPRPPAPEVKIITDTPAVTVEEVVPDSVSEMKLLAPEEVYSTRKQKVLQTASERNETDRKRSRRLKKKKQRLRQKLSQTKSNNTKTDKSKDSANEDGQSLRSSTKFFERLQEKSNQLQQIQVKAKPMINKQQKNLAKKLKL